MMTKPKDETDLERCFRCNSTDLIDHYNPLTEEYIIECAICNFSWTGELEPVGKYNDEDE